MDQHVVVPVPLGSVVTIEDLLRRVLAVVLYVEPQPAEGRAGYSLVLEQYVEGAGEVARSIHPFARELL